MAKEKRIYSCKDCGAQTPQWAGRCGDCGAWNSLAEEIQAATSSISEATISRHASYAGEQKGQVQSLAEVTSEQAVRWTTGLSELDRVLGGGLVTGSVVLIGGDPAMVFAVKPPRQIDKLCQVVTGGGYWHYLDSHGGAPLAKTSTLNRRKNRGVMARKSPIGL